MIRKQWLSAGDLQEYIVGNISRTKELLWEFKEIFPQSVLVTHNKQNNVSVFLKKTEIQHFCETMHLKMRDTPKSKTPELPKKGPYDFSPVQLQKYIFGSALSISKALKKCRHLMPDYIQEKASGSTKALFLHAEDILVIRQFCESAKLKMRSQDSVDKKLEGHEYKNEEDLSSDVLAKYIDAHPVTIRRRMIQYKDRMGGAVAQKIDAVGRLSWYLNKTHVKEFCKITGLRLRQESNTDVLSVLENLKKAPQWLSSGELSRYVDCAEKTLRGHLRRLKDKMPEQIIEKQVRSGAMGLYLDKNYITQFCRLANLQLRYQDSSVDDININKVPFKQPDELNATELHEYIYRTPSDLITYLRKWRDAMPDAIVERRGATGTVTLYLKKDKIKEFCRLSGLRMREKRKEPKDQQVQIPDSFVFKDTETEWLSSFSLQTYTGMIAKAVEEKLLNLQNDKRMKGKIKMVYSVYAKHDIVCLHNDKESIDMFLQILKEEREEAQEWLSMPEVAKRLGRQTIPQKYIIKFQSVPANAGRVKIVKMSDGKHRFLLHDDEESIRLLQKLMPSDWLSTNALEKYCKLSEIAIRPRVAKMRLDPRMTDRIKVHTTPSGKEMFYLHNDPETINLFQTIINDNWLTPSMLRNHCSISDHQLIEKYLWKMLGDKRMKDRIKPIYSNKAKREVCYLHDDAESIALFQTILDEMKLKGFTKGKNITTAMSKTKNTKQKIFDKPKDEYQI